MPDVQRDVLVISRTEKHSRGSTWLRYNYSIFLRELQGEFYKNKRQVMRYFISCSRFSNNGESKKSLIDISKPSHIFLIVEIVVLLLRPQVILLRVDCVIPHSVDNLLMVIFLSLHNSSIRSFTASPIVIITP